MGSGDGTQVLVFSQQELDWVFSSAPEGLFTDQNNSQSISWPENDSRGWGNHSHTQNVENLWADSLGHFTETSEILTDFIGRPIPETHLGLDSLNVFVWIQSSWNKHTSHTLPKTWGGTGHKDMDVPIQPYLIPCLVPWPALSNRDSREQSLLNIWYKKQTNGITA